MTAPEEPPERLAPGRPPGRVQRGPFVVTCPPGKYALCRCQRSGSYPYCDGSHRGSDVRPIKLVLERETTVEWCACGRSGAFPFCDKTHERLTD